MAAIARAERISLQKKANVIYKDFVTDVLFNSDTKDVNLVDNENSVRQSIINILLTNIGERVYNTNFGSDINKMLFEPISPQTTSAITKLIEVAVSNYEPRARVHEVQATPSYDESSYAVTIVFSTINRTEPIALELLLNRVR